MNRRDLLLSAALALAPVSTPAWAARGAVPPKTARKPVRIEQLGRVRTDDYAWLKDANWKGVWRNPNTLRREIKRHLDEENAYASAILAPTRTLQTELLREMRGKVAKDEDTPPYRDGDWLYYARVAPGGHRPSYYRRRGNEEQLLLDSDARAHGATFMHIANAKHSPDHKRFAWAEDREGSEKFRIFVKDLTTGTVAAPIADAFGNYTFSPDSQSLFWVFRDENSRPTKVFRRPASGGEDTLVHHEHDPAFFVDVTRTASNSHVMIRIWNGDSSEVRLIAAEALEAPPLLVSARAPGLLYSLEQWNGRFVVLTNADGATDFKLMWADDVNPQRATWRDWIGHRPGRLIMSMLSFKDHFVRVERAKGNPTIVVTKRAGLTDAAVHFDEAAYAASTDEPQEFSGSTLRFTFESPRLPKRWLALDMETAKQTPLSTSSTIGAADRYVVERLYADAADGEKIPITVVRKKTTGLDGSAPLLISGYGAYGFSTEAEYSPALLALVDRGWVYSIAHVRGGSEKGRSWYLAARARKKKNSFSDFVACAEHVIRQGYTSKGKVVAQGFSAGGLLIGGALNIKPELWAGIIARAPFVDMMNTMSDATHPLVPLARPDWGDPLANAEDYDYIASYSPYENVTSQPYPAVLATTSVADDRVGYWEPAKWIAKLREKSTSGKPMLLVSDAQGGHGGTSGTDAELRRASLQYAFAIWAVSKAKR